MNSLRDMVIGGVFALAAAGAAAADDAKGAYTTSDVVAALSAAGMTATVSEQKVKGASWVKGEMKSGGGDVVFWVRPSGCNGTPPACSALILFANFDLGREATRSDYDIANKYNDTHEFGRAYVLAKEKRIGVDYVVELGGGVASGYVGQRLKRWSAVVTSFVEHFKTSMETKTDANKTLK